MKLAEMSLTSAKKINKVLESRFGFAINYDSLTVEKAEKLSETITANLDKIRHSTNLHTAEKNPRYMELLTVKEGLNRWLQERAIPQTEEVEVITEGEVENAELVLAAKDMVDRVQGMLEDIGKMINEDLPPLTDAIRDEMDSSTADSFNSSMNTALQGLLDNLGTARTGVDEASRILVGETPAEPMGMEEPGEIEAPEMGDEMSDMEDDFGAADAAVGGEEPMGRKRAE